MDPRLRTYGLKDQIFPTPALNPPTGALKLNFLTFDLHRPIHVFTFVDLQTSVFIKTLKKHNVNIFFFLSALRFVMSWKNRSLNQTLILESFGNIFMLHFFAKL